MITTPSSLSPSPHPSPAVQPDDSSMTVMVDCELAPMDLTATADAVAQEDGEENKTFEGV